MPESPNKKTRQEEKIQNRLRLIEMEDSREHIFSMKPYFNPHPTQLKSMDFRDISDWGQQHSWHQDKPEPSPQNRRFM